MVLTVLTDSDVYKILHSLTKQDVLDVQSALLDALHLYSTANEDDSCCSSYQPLRTTLKRNDGLTTLLMPASSSAGLGFKVVTLAAPAAEPKRNSTGSSLASLSLFESSKSSSPRSSISGVSSASTASTASVSSSATFKAPSSVLSKDSTTPKGVITLLGKDGAPTALINAEEITAFRTALTTLFLFPKRKSVHTVTIFGAGKQAYWHARLAMIMRGDEIHHLNIINRSFDRSRDLIMKLYNPLPGDESYVNPIGHKYNSKTKSTILTPASPEYERLLKEYVRAADVIFCTTPSTEPLFPASYLTNPQGRKKGRFIGLIGSYKPHMLEIHPDILKQAVAPHHEHRHFHKHQKEGGAIIVDSLDACLKEAGEIIQAKLEPHQVVEVGELLMLKKEAERQKAAGETDCQLQQSAGLRDWLLSGNVIFKAVGMGLMDVVVGNELARLGREKGIGTFVENF